MRLTADTNVLVRAIVADDAKQARAAQTALEKAEVIAVTVPAVCELVWVLSRGYGLPLADIGAAIRTLIDAANVKVNRPAIESGLALLDKGGDFADGAIAFEGAALGGDDFASFDKAAVSLLKSRGLQTRLLT